MTMSGLLGSGIGDDALRRRFVEGETSDGSAI